MSGDGWRHMPPDQPRICAGCGERVKLNSEAIWFAVSQRKTWHWRCRPGRGNQ